MLHYDTVATVWTAYEGTWIDDPDGRTFRARQPVFRAEQNILEHHTNYWQINGNASAEVEAEDAPAPDWQGALSCMTENVVRVGPVTE